jgi:hypothetical protein
MAQDVGVMVLVYDYRFWDSEAEAMARSKRPATLEAIHNGLGVAIIESGRKVPRSMVDTAGRYVGDAEGAARGGG